MKPWDKEIEMIDTITAEAKRRHRKLIAENRPLAEYKKAADEILAWHHAALKEVRKQFN